MREDYMITIIDTHGQAQVGVVIMIDEVDVGKLKSMFSSLKMVNLLERGSTVEITKVEDRES